MVNWMRLLQYHSHDDLAEIFDSFPASFQHKLVRKLTPKHAANNVQQLDLWIPALPAERWRGQYKCVGVKQLRLTNRPIARERTDADDREFQVLKPVFGPCVLRQQLLPFQPWWRQQSELVQTSHETIDVAGRRTAVAEVFQSLDLIRLIVVELRGQIAAGSVCWTWFVIARRLSKDAERLRWTKTYGRPFPSRIAAMINAEGTIETSRRCACDDEPEELDHHDDCDGGHDRAVQWIKDHRVGFAAFCNPGEDPLAIFEDGTTDDFDGIVDALLTTPSGAVICSHGCKYGRGRLLHYLSRLSPNGIVSQRVRLMGSEQTRYEGVRFSAMACDGQHLFLAAGRGPLQASGTRERDPRSFTQIVKIDVATLKPAAHLDPAPDPNASSWHGSTAPTTVTAHGMAVHGSKLFIAFNASDAPNAHYDKLAVFDHSEVDIVFDDVIAGSLARPRGLAVVGAELFVCDFGTHRLVALDVHDGIERRSIGGPGTAPGRLSGPEGICAAGDLLVVSELLARRIQIFSLELHAVQVLRMPGTGLLRSLCYAPSSGFVFVADTQRRQVHVLVPCSGSVSPAPAAEPSRCIQPWEAPDEAPIGRQQICVDTRAGRVYESVLQPAHLRATNGVLQEVPLDESWRAWSMLETD